MSAKSDPHGDAADTTYYYRRSLGVREMLPAIGAGIVVGAAVWYVMTLARQRTRLVPRDARPLRDAGDRPRGSRRRAHGG